MGVAQSLEQFLNAHGIPVRAVAAAAGIQEEALQASIGRHPGRRLSGDEFLRICRYLGKDPYYFWSAPAFPVGCPEGR